MFLCGTIEYFQVSVVSQVMQNPVIWQIVYLLAGLSLWHVNTGEGQLCQYCPGLEDECESKDAVKLSLDWCYNTELPWLFQKRSVVDSRFLSPYFMPTSNLWCALWTHSEVNAAWCLQCERWGRAWMGRTCQPSVRLGGFGPSAIIFHMYYLRTLISRSYGLICLAHELLFSFFGEVVR